MSKVYLSLGSNLGNKEQNIVEAIATIGAEAGVVRKISDYFYSEADGFESSNTFVNIAMLLLTDKSPLQLLSILEDIEVRLGRMHKSNGAYADRIIDIDILLYDTVRIDTEKLKIPHPRMLERDFVLIPLKEIAPELPIFNQ